MTSAGEKIKVLHVTTVSGIGGAERMILDLAGHIDRGRFDLEVASLHGKGPLGDRVRSLQTAYHDLGFGKPLCFPGRVRRLFKAEKYDVIQLHGDTAEVILRPLARQLGAAAVISTVHGLASFASPLRNRLLRHNRRWVDLYISVSAMGEQMLIEKRGVAADRIRVIHPGMPAPGAKDGARAEAMRRELGIPAGQLLVLTVANLRLLKGHFTILEAAARLKQAGPLQAVFVFVGEDRSGGEVARRAAALGVADIVRFTGFQSRVHEFLNAADIFLLPSQSEGLPLSILEAMAMGVAVIATPVGGVPEIIADGENGLLVAPGDAAAVAATLRRLGGEENFRKAIGQAGRLSVEAKFNLRDMVEHYQLVYQQLYDDAPTTP